MLDFLKEMKIIRVLNAVAAGQTAQLGAAVDLAGYDAVCHILILNTVTSGCVLGMQLSDAATSGGTYTNITPAVLSFTDAGTASNTLMILDVLVPQQRFVKCNVTRTTQNAVLDGMIAIAYRSKGRPITADVSVIASALAVATS